MKPSRSGMLHILWMIYVSAVFMSDTAESRVVYYEKQMDSGDADYADLLEVPRKIPSTSYIVTPSSNITNYGTAPPTYNSTAQPYGPTSMTSNYQTTTSYGTTTSAPPKYSKSKKKKVIKTSTIGSYVPPTSTYSPLYDQTSQSYAAITQSEAHKSGYSQIRITYSTSKDIKEKYEGVDSYNTEQQAAIMSALNPPTKYRTRKPRIHKSTRKPRTITTTPAYEAEPEYICPCEAESHEITELYPEVEVEEETTRPPKKYPRKPVNHYQDNV